MTTTRNKRRRDIASGSAYELPPATRSRELGRNRALGLEGAKRFSDTERKALAPSLTAIELASLLGKDAEWLNDYRLAALSRKFQPTDEQTEAIARIKREERNPAAREDLVKACRQRAREEHEVRMRQCRANAKAEQIVGRFNGHLLKNLILVCEEAFWAGSKDAEGALKNLITESELTIEQKGVDPYSAPNYSRLLMISNNDWVVPVGADPRRYFVLEVVNDRANDRAYFDPIWEQMNSGGVEAMLHELLYRDISEADLRSAPVTDGLREQREQSLTSTERWLLDVAEAGGVRDHKEDCRIQLMERETTILTDKVRDAAKIATGPADHRNLERTLGQLLKRTGVRKVKNRKKGGARTDFEYVYEFPPLTEFKSAVMEVLQVRIDGHERAGPTIH